MGPVSEVGPEPSACRIRWSPHVDSLSMELNRRMDDLRVSGVRTHPCTPDICFVFGCRTLRSKKCFSRPNIDWNDFN